MADSMRGQIRPGALVTTDDGQLGRVERATPTLIEVVVDRTQRHLTLPRSLVRDVRADGAILLTARAAEVERLAVTETRGDGQGVADTLGDVGKVELQEERLVARKTLEETGRVLIRKEVDEVPRRLEVDAYYEDVQIEHVPIGRVVKEQESPREEDGVYIVPVYEEQLVVVKRLVLREELHIRRHGATETRLFEDTVRRERLVIEDPDSTGRVREHYATERPEGEAVAGDTALDEAEPESPGLLERLGRKVLE